jgi:3-methyladenine DNA glycosylase AlkD
MGERPKTQREKFEEAARELKTDQSDEAFEASVNKIAHALKLTNEEIKELARKKRERE